MATHTPIEDSTRVHAENIGRNGDVLPVPIREDGPARTKVRKSPFRVAAIVFLVFLLIGLATITGGYLILKVGLDSQGLTNRAESAVQSLLGSQMVAKIGSMRVSLDRSMFLALEAGEIQVRESDNDALIGDIGTIRLGFDPLSILSGNMQLDRIKIGDVRFNVDAFVNADESAFALTVRDASGQVDPGRLPAAVFDLLRLVADAFESGAAKTIEAENVIIDFLTADQNDGITVTSAVLSLASPKVLTFDATVSIGEGASRLRGNAERDETSGRIGRFELNVEDLALTPAIFGVSSDDSLPVAPIGRMSVQIAGEQAVDGGGDRIDVIATLPEFNLPLGGGESAAITGDVKLLLRQGSGKVEIEAANLFSGRNTFKFHGAFGPVPDGVIDKTLYRFELVSDGSTLSPEDSPEPPLEFFARLAGTYNHDGFRFSVDDLGLRTDGGEVLGTASLVFGDRTPAIFLALRVPELPVSHAKQLWLLTAGMPVRKWVLDNVFGGTIRDSKLEFSVVANRLADDIPLRGDEVFGEFQIDGTRFDSAGEIPPVRDAFGTVSFQGTDVDIYLKKGTAFLPSGRNVSARDGSLAIRKAHLDPVIGNLDIDIAGDAGAVAELAEFQPFDALRDLEFTPEDLSGSVTGHIVSEIPIGDIEGDRPLTWQVALNYTDLAIAKPIDGQLVSEAQGSLLVTPDKAVIKAKARLNGAMAQLDLVEPLAPAPAQRKRKVSLEMDDEARATVVPGLNSVLLGTIIVDLLAEGSEGQEIQADLTDAVIHFPWIGWRKGEGVPAAASFIMTQDGEILKLSNFELKGETFFAAGSIEINNGELSKVDISDARLNRDDNFSILIERLETGYNVAIEGHKADLRSVIKTFGANFETTAKSVGSDPISLVANLEQAIGFNREVLSNLSVKYDGTGTSVDTLRITGESSSGNPVSYFLGDEEDGRALRVSSTNAGSVLRFLNAYKHMQGGTIDINLVAEGDGPMIGHVDARDFWLVEEPRLSSVVSNEPRPGERSLRSAVQGEFDVSKVYFNRGYSEVEMATGYAKLRRGILRGPMIGTTFQGTFYDPDGQISITGTFMPAYGLNSIFSGIPLVGPILGNGRDRGLIGITYKLVGPASSPRMALNPISIMAPGVFRSIFEFR